MPKFLEVSDTSAARAAIESASTGAFRSVEESASLAAAVSSVYGTPAVLRGSESTYTVDSTLDITDDSYLDLMSSTITQANNTNLSRLVNVFLSLTTGVKRSDLALFVDGNRDNNATAVTGVRIEKIRKAWSHTKITALNCDTGVLVDGDTEFARLDVHAEACGTGLQITTGTAVGGVSADELLINLVAHNVVTALKTDGDVKTASAVNFAVEQCTGWGADINVGWFQFGGVLRGCGTANDGTGGYRQGANMTGANRMLQTRGSLSVICNGTGWAVDLQGGATLATQFHAQGTYGGGLRVTSGVETGSSVVFDMLDPPTANAEAVLFGGGAGSVNGFHLLPGSRIVNASGVAVNFDRATNCVVEPDLIQGGIIFGSTNGGNIIRIPRTSFGNVTFTNNRTQLDNRVVFAGRHTLASLDGLATKFRGMYAENVSDFGGTPAYYDGNAWRPLISQNRVTSTAASGNPTFNIGTFDQLNITAQSAALNNITVSGTSTAYDGQPITVRIKDNGTARALTSLGASFRLLDGVFLPATTIPNKTLYIHGRWNTTDSVVDVYSVEGGALPQIELGDASDTTITRASAGVIAVEGKTVSTRLTATATLNFGSISAQSEADLTITVAGAVTGDAVALGVPTAAVTAGIAYTAWVSAADTVTVRAHNYTAGAIDPASGSFRATIIR